MTECHTIVHCEPHNQAPSSAVSRSALNRRCMRLPGFPAALRWHLEVDLSRSTAPQPSPPHLQLARHVQLQDQRPCPLEAACRRGHEQQTRVLQRARLLQQPQRLGSVLRQQGGFISPLHSSNRWQLLAAWAPLSFTLPLSLDVPP